MMLTLISRGNLWFTKWVGNNRFKGSWKRRIRSDADTGADIFKKHFYIYVTVIFHT